MGTDTDTDTDRNRGNTRNIFGTFKPFWRLLYFFIVISLFIIPDPLFSEQKQIQFLWAFLYQNQTEKIQTIDPSAGSIKLAHNDKLKVFLKPLNDTYLYLMLIDSEDNLLLLFPEYLAFFSEGYTSGVKYYIPEGPDNWFSLDNSGGEEEFILIASSSRLFKLEQKITNYRQKPASRHKKELLDEIKRIKLQSFSFDDFPETPTVIAGNFRGIKETEEITANKVDTIDFYTKTIIILH